MIDVDKVKKMTRAKNFTVLSILLMAIAACSNDGNNEPQVSNDTQAVAASTAKSNDGDLQGARVTPGAPYKLDYEIIGTPVIGSPLTIQLGVTSLHDARSVQLEYRFKDPTALILAESQPASIVLEAADNEKAYQQRISVIPQREGRFYLNVSASFDTPDGTMSTVTAIPIQVGSGSRELTRNGDLETDENGEAIRVLSEE